MKTFQAVMNINVFGSVYVAKHACVAMSKNKVLNDKNERGVIIFVSSVAAEEAQRGQVAYGASKGALNGMVMPMSRDLGKFGIRVASIQPGIFWTPLSDKMPQKVRVRLEADTPLKRMGQPEEFAHFAAACVENTYINGVNLRLDGAAKLSNL